MAQNAKSPAKKQDRTTPDVSVRIDRLVDRENSNIRAVASANIGGAFAVHGLLVVDSQKGLFVRMPQESYQKDGKTVYTDIFHPITAEARNELADKVLDAYQQRISGDENESEKLDEPVETDALTQSM